LFFVVSTSAVDCLERFVSELTYYVSSEMLNPTNSLTLCSEWCCCWWLCWWCLF